MDVANQILTQLSEADRLANARNPHCRRLALVLLDNIVELQLRRQAERAFIFDATRWKAVRAHNRSKRRQVLRYHAPLVEFAQSQGWIDRDDEILIKFAHQVRNSTYHEGRFDSSDGELAIRLLYGLIKRRFPEWGTGRGIFFCPDEAPMPISKAHLNESGRAPLFADDADPPAKEKAMSLDDGREWILQIPRVLTYEGERSTREIIHDRIASYIDAVERDVLWIRKDSKGLNLLDMLSWRLTILTPAFSQAYLRGEHASDYNWALNVYASLLPEEERLLDIDSPHDRAAACNDLFRKHRFRKEFMPIRQLRRLRESAMKALSLPEARSIQWFLKMEERLREKSEVLREFSRDLDGYIQWLVDFARGK
jgi:hypothetical protein